MLCLKYVHFNQSSIVLVIEAVIQILVDEFFFFALGSEFHHMLHHICEFQVHCNLIIPRVWNQQKDTGT